MIITRTDGTAEKYNSNRIYRALKQASLKVEGIKDSDIIRETNKITKRVKDLGLEKISLDELEEIIFSVLLEDYPTLLSSYRGYRKEREILNINKSDFMKVVKQVGVQTDRDNANVGNNFSAKLLRISSHTNKFQNLGSMPKALAKLHETGYLYYHDLDSYNLTSNCLHIPTGKMLNRGFNTGYGTTTRPRSIETAANLSCILLQSSQNDLFGGQSHPNFDNDLAPYVEETRKKEILEVLFNRYLDRLDDKWLPMLEYITNKYGNKIEKWNFKDIYEDAQFAECTAERYKLEEIESEIEGIQEDINLGYYSLTKIEQLKVNGEVITSVRQAMQSIVYNLNTMHSRAGSQVPFSSLNIGLPQSEDAALIDRLFLEEYEKGLGKREQPIFPNIIFRCKKGVNRKGDPYYYLYQLACKVAAKRMNPTFMNMDASFNKKFYDRGIIPATMGCRTYLCSNVNGPEGPDARGNNACTTINLPRLGIETILTLGKEAVGTEQAISLFFESFDKVINAAKDSLLHRFETLKKLKVKDLPFAAGQGLMLGSEGLDPNDSIEPILLNGTWGIGFIGLAETLKVLTGYHHGESETSRQLGFKIIQHLRAMTDKFTQELHLNFGCYATPAEGLSDNFTKQDIARFGQIEWVTSKGFYTNSYHVPVDYTISIKNKLEIEAPYHALCNSGHISYIELDGTPTGEVIETIVSGAYDTTDISYIGINFHIRYCKECGHYLDINDGHVCPKCGSSHIQGISRVTGYLSLDERFGPGKVKERSKRVAHSESNFGHNRYNLI